jgi:hypothetical protein
MKPILTSKEKRDTLQPLDPKTGYMNEHFNKVYGKENNPYVGTERDKGAKKWQIDSNTGLPKDKARKLEKQRKEAEKNSWENIKIK